ncbi:MAG TPA: hypothetical protein VFX76_19170 [Roseiflexaceae bacterium]|nr:hypothetical protein [Roseiflexaceae bacterium]
MTIIGALIAVGSAVAFVAVGALTLFGGARATQDQVVPGFRPDRPSQAERALTLLGVWGPVLLIALLCLLAGIQIVRVGLAALLG